MAAKELASPSSKLLPTKEMGGRKYQQGNEA
jgi:hypothetical protein